MQSSPARRRLFEVSGDGWRVRIQRNAVDIVRIKRAVIDFLVEPIQCDRPVRYTPLPCRYSPCAVRTKCS